MGRDYYRIIGISRTATQVEVELAYERACKQYGPHEVGGLAAHLPRYLEEAFKALLDAETRRDYDRRLREEEREILPDHPTDIEVVSLFRSFGRVAPSLRAILEHIRTNFRPVAPKLAPPKPLRLEILLTAREATRGGAIPVEIPVYRRCKTCGGSGMDGFTPCDECGTGGIVPEYTTIQIEYPPHVADRAVIRRDLRQLGVANLEVVILVRLSEKIPGADRV